MHTKLLLSLNGGVIQHLPCAYNGSHVENDREEDLTHVALSIQPQRSFLGVLARERKEGGRAEEHRGTAR